MQLLVERNGDGIRLYSDDSIHIDAVMREEIVLGKLAVVEKPHGGAFMQHSGDLNTWRTVDTGYSPPIDIRLLTDGGDDFDVSHSANGELRLRNPKDLEPCEAWLITWIDGESQRTRVMLNDGIRADEPLVKFEK